MTHNNNNNNNNNTTAAPTAQPTPVGPTDQSPGRWRTHGGQQPAALVAVQPRHEGDGVDPLLLVDPVHFVRQEESVHRHGEPQGRVLEENLTLQSSTETCCQIGLDLCIKW